MTLRAGPSIRNSLMSAHATCHRSPTELGEPLAFGRGFVNYLLDARQCKVAIGERCHLGPCEWPRHQLKFFVRVPGPGDHQKCARWSHHGGDMPNSCGPQFPAVHLHGICLEHQVVLPAPVSGRYENVRRGIVHFRAGKPGSRTRHRRGRHVERRDLESDVGQVFGIVTKPAADHEGTAARSRWLHTVQPGYEMTVWRKPCPWHPGFAAGGPRIELLEPAIRVTARLCRSCHLPGNRSPISRIGHICNIAAASGVGYVPAQGLGRIFAAED